MINSIKLLKIKQKFRSLAIDDIKTNLINELSRLNDSFLPDKKIAIAVGSRGISNIAEITKLTVEYIKAKGAMPFIFPAMGSHGGANTEGQAEILASYGINEKSMGCPIKSSMEVIELPKFHIKNKLFISKDAFLSDGILLINRIKPHTDYHGDYESGLVKMAVIGVGKHHQALEIHKYGVFGLKELLLPSAKEMFNTGKFIGGIALVEDAYDHTMMIKALSCNEIIIEEPKILAIAKENMPCLPIKMLDILIIDQMGKNISGVGMDPNIIGRMKINGFDEPEFPKIKQIVVDDLTEESHGNSLGMGLADVISKKLFDKIDFKALNENAFTSSFLERAKIPVVAKDMKNAIEFALRACSYINPGDERVVRIKNTLTLDEVYISENCLKDCTTDIEILSDAATCINTNNELTNF